MWYLEYLWQINPFYLVLGVPGVGLALWRKKRVAVPLVVFVLVYFVLIGGQIVHFDRNVLPVLVLLVAAAGVAMDAVFDWMSSTLGRWALSSVTGVIVLVVLAPSLLMLPALLQSPGPSGRAMAQAQFDKILETPEGQRDLCAMNIVAEGYTVYLDPAYCGADYVATITGLADNLADFRQKDYDIAILGSGMFNRFYENPDVYPNEIRLYDEFFTAAPYIAFENAYAPLEFREDGARVYVFLLTERAQQWASGRFDK